MRILYIEGYNGWQNASTQSQQKALECTVLFVAKSCTDNFQIVDGKFNYQGLDWHSVEQAFQSLKFPMGSIAQEEIYKCAPRNPNDEATYGIDVWSLGQPREDTKMRSDWEQEKVKVMLLLNLAKYSSNKQFRDDLLETENYRIIAQGSTANWTFTERCNRDLCRIIAS